MYVSNLDTSFKAARVVGGDIYPGVRFVSTAIRTPHGDYQCGRGRNANDIDHRDFSNIRMDKHYQTYQFHMDTSRETEHLIYG